MIGTTTKQPVVLAKRGRRRRRPRCPVVTVIIEATELDAPSVFKLWPGDDAVIDLSNGHITITYPKEETR